jgi:DNA-binding MarR family transcriptional regulator
LPQPAHCSVAWRKRMASHRRRRTSFSGQFAGRLIEMLESPAYRTLSLSAHRVLSRIEVEFGHHGGQDNGKLPVTFDQLAEYGIDRASIAPAIRELEALGFIEVTERGCAGNADLRRPNKFRLTYRGAVGVLSDGTHEWRRIATLDEAKAIATLARRASKRRLHRVRNQKASAGSSTIFSKEILT